MPPRAASRALALALVCVCIVSCAGQHAAVGHHRGSNTGGSRLPARRFGAHHSDDDGDSHSLDVPTSTDHASPRKGRPLPIVLPSPTDPTKLTLQHEGLNALRLIAGPIAPVVVIGPYRSGKSFLLNQLLGVPCDEGFGVGHTRKTETKGVWIWSEPTLVPGVGPGDPPTSVVYVDTEGFEATGASDAYDDRIFALSSIVASVLVYNLPETVKEGDIEKLSFALELAREFSGRSSRGGSETLDGNELSSLSSAESDDDLNLSLLENTQDDLGAWDASQLEAFLPHSLLWLIQRDFLTGSTVGDMVDGALRDVNNPTNDEHVTELNRVRASLRNLAKHNRAFGLTQPHLERTKLCELGDDKLEPTYVTQRETLRKIVRNDAVAKSSLGAALAASGGGIHQAKDAPSGNNKQMTGVSLAALMERSVNALNEGDFPTAGSVVDAFNRDALDLRVAAYTNTLDAITLPAENAELELMHRKTKKEQLLIFRKERFGRGAVTLKALAKTLDDLFTQRSEKNAFVSGKECDLLASRCEDVLIKMQKMRLPSLRKFDAAAEKECHFLFDKKCVGPSKETSANRVRRTIERERNAFAQTYNARLLNGLLLIAIGGVVTFRFLWVVPLAELVSWALFLSLEVGPKFYFAGTGGDGLFESGWWQTAAEVWETAVYNPVVDMDVLGPVLVVGVLGLAVWMRVRRCAQFVHGYCPCCVPSCCQPLLGVKNSERAKTRRGRKTEGGRDLDV